LTNFRNRKKRIVTNGPKRNPAKFKNSKISFSYSASLVWENDLFSMGKRTISNINRKRYFKDVPKILSLADNLGHETVKTSLERIFLVALQINEL